MEREQDGRKAGQGKDAVTELYLERAAIFYLQRYASSVENLRQVLMRKAKRRAGRASETNGDRERPDFGPLVDRVVAKAIESGLLDDRSYTEAKLGSLLRRGTSARAARAKLAAKGVGSDLLSAALAEAEPDEVSQALRYAERRRLGPWRRHADAAFRERDLAALCRAGFPYRVARAALEADPDQLSPEPQKRK